MTTQVHGMDQGTGQRGLDGVLAYRHDRTDVPVRVRHNTLNHFIAGLFENLFVPMY